MHKDSKEYCKECDVCQRTRKPSRSDEFPLNLQVTLQAFDKRTIYFMGPIQPLGKKIGERYIIKTKEYMTRWVEA